MREFEHRSASELTALFVSQGGVVATVTDEREPYEALDDLMSVIEALCPTWPPREISSDMGKLLL
jgi:hypothetical protein